MPVIFILAYLFVAVSIFADTPGTALTGLGILAGFIVLYFVVKGRSSSRRPTSGDRMD